MSGCGCCPPIVFNENCTCNAAVDPQACNAAQDGPDGLYVARTTLTGIAPGGNVGAERSVDIDIDPPDDPAACPQEWVVGARLTPVSGQTTMAAAVDLVPTWPDQDTWTDTDMVLTLPEPGRYHVSGEVRANICANIPDSGESIRATNLWTRVRLVNDATDAVLLPSVGLAQHQFSVGFTTGFQSCFSGTHVIDGHVTVTAPTTIRVQAGLQGGGPGNGLQGGAVLQTSGAHEGRLQFHKIAD